MKTITIKPNAEIYTNGNRVNSSEFTGKSFNAELVPNQNEHVSVVKDWVFISNGVIYTVANYKSFVKQ